MRTNYARQRREPIRFGSPEFPTEVGYNSRGHDDYATHLEYVHYRYGRVVVVDGYVWQPTDEPRYVVQAFGMGGNQGGTDLYVTNYDNPNIAPDSYFRADQFERAQTYAIELARRRGDTDSIARLSQQTPRIQVLVAEAVTLQAPPAQR